MPERLEDVDFEEVLLRLTLHAYRLFRAIKEERVERVLEGGEGGETPEDLAMATLGRLLDPEDHTVRWDSGKGGAATTRGILAYLKKVLHSDFLDLKRKGRYRRADYLSTHGTTDGDGTQAMTLDDLVAQLEPPDLAAIRQEQRVRMIRFFEQWPELLDIVKLQLDPDGCNEFQNQDLAVLLDTTVADIENRKKRIQRLSVRAAGFAIGPKRASHVAEAE